MAQAVVDETTGLSSSYHYELAVSLQAGNVDTKCEESIFEAAIAVALSTDETAQSRCRALYCSLSGKDWRDVHLVRTFLELHLLVRQPAKVLVLLPGDYLLLLPVLTAKVTMLAAAPGVILRSRGAHALHLEGNADLLLRGISFQLAPDTKAASLACVAIGGPGCSLKLVDCEIPNWPGDCGILIDGGACSLSRCTLSNICKQAIEVRQGGRLDAYASSVTNCSQGVIAYGGARTVSIIDCTFRGMSQEGILAQGSHVNAPTAAQREFGGGPQNIVSVGAVGWGISSALDLDLDIRNSVIEAVKIGVSIDCGCHSTIHNCKFRDCKLFSILVKGESPTLIADSVVSYGNKEGVRVGANYAAPVQLVNNSFVGKSIHKAVIDEFNGGENRSGFAFFPRRMGIWSYPVVQQRSQHFTNESERTKALALAGAAEDGSSIPDYVEKFRSMKLTEGLSAKLNASPIADMMRISRVISLSGSSPLYYAIGNTYGFDVSGGSTWAALDSSDDNTFNIFLAACGDIRNILKTVDAAASKNSSCRLHFLLNDISCSILARDVLLLSLIERDSVSTQDLISIWANHALTPAQGRLVHESCERLSNGEWPSFLLLPTNDSTKQLEGSLRECFRQWLACSVTLESMLKTRNAVLVPAAMSEECFALSLGSLNCDGKAISMREEKELSNYLSCGSLHWGKNKAADKLTEINPTILEAPHLQYHLYWSSSIFRAIRLGDDHQFSPQTLAQRLVAALQPQVSSVRQAMRRGLIQFSLMLGDIVNCGMDLSSGTWKHPSANSSHGVTWRVSKFHFIDTSNVADYVSLPVVLQLCSRFLHRSESAVIHAQSLQWREKRATYFSSSFGMKRCVYSQILGLVLSNARALSITEISTEMQMAWRWNQKSKELSRAQLVENLTSSAKRICLPRANRGGGINSSGSLAIAHLTLCATGSPSEAKSVIKTIASSSDEASKYSWQLTLAGKIQAEEPHVIGAEFVIASFVAELDYFKFMANVMADAPLHLVLVVTSAPLTRGDSIPWNKCLQFIDAFAFDRESCRVQLMLTKTLITRIAPKSYAITLCGCLDNSGQTVLTLSKSVLMNGLQFSDWQQQTSPGTFWA